MTNPAQQHPGATANALSPVHIVSKAVVTCSNPAVSLPALGESPVFKLGPLDQLALPFIPVAVVLVYRPTSPAAAPGLLEVDRLQFALSRLLDYYPHLTGRLQMNKADNTVEVVQLGAGMEFRVATCDARLPDTCGGVTQPLVVTELPDGGNALLGAFNPWDDDGCGDHIFTLQHTRFACGSVALGVRVRHCVTDADGCFQLLRDLAELAFGRRAASGARLPTAYHLLAPAATAATAATSGGTEAETSTPAVPPPPVVGRILRFSGRELERLKAHATLTAAEFGQQWLSTFDVLAAHLYQRTHVARVQYAKSRGADPSQLSTDFLSPFNLRGRLGLPARYFPNAVSCAVFTYPADSFATAPLSAVAATIHDAMRQMTKQEAVDTLRWMSVQSDKRRIAQHFRPLNGGFMVSQWNKFDMYPQLDFDVGADSAPIPPTLVSTPFSPISLIDGLAYFLATEDQLSVSASTTTTQSVDVAIALIEPLWELLDCDPAFRQFRDTP
ncbi:hypothetical protein CAOG_02316 [Capsaspora owczarzaki ATCC 30864]|uniref:Transferase n=1 Tax=Capsaspora owczarzaki (strain ATCC 30864) TaxID=595528 RepID=A0A0D2U7S9_CAPO3|nr:hypothetical protein CAOG_02316 [Capsaspora owczarzaki ATCC 30864]KJE91136.1 hypothetical protein CAOG_002316 [Capsaspora owczarzaki ATCC 30864]|eukprot:XP_004349066.1 hypothetical protein CAOG_02316 [Capsaspora owczarzaki ATCC 30864]